MGPIVEDFDMLRHRSDLLMSSTPIYNFEDDNGDKNTSSQLSRNTIDQHKDQKPAAAPTLSECIQAAGIAQSRLADRGKKKSKVNDRIVAMHLKRVAGEQSLMQEQKFLISATDNDNQNRQLYLQELRNLQKELASGIEDLLFAEDQIIEDEETDVSQQNTVDFMIDATKSSILDRHTQTTRVSPMPQFWALDDDDNLEERCL